MGELEDMFRELETSVNGMIPAERVKEIWGDEVTLAEPDMTIKAPDHGNETRVATYGQDDDSVADVVVSEQPPGVADVSVMLSIHADGSASMTLPGASVTLSPRRASPQTGGEYEIGEVLGIGGMGVVNRARQASLDRTIVVKTIRPEYAARIEAREKFITEALATGSLDHPNVVPVHDMGVAEDGGLFYVMKEVKGRNWRAVMPELSEMDNLDILLRVCDAVAFAHDRGIIHRDIKPENIMLGDFGEVLLMDWGLAAAVHPSAKATQLSYVNACAGTPSFMAPEMARGVAQDIGPWSDQYLLGATLFTILTGMAAHPGKNAQEAIQNAAVNTIRESERRDEWMEVAFRAMELQPANRFASVKAFQEALAGCRVHHDSIVLTSEAESHLEKAEDAADSAAYPRAINAYEQALVLWRDNPRATAGLVKARRAYASYAVKKEDFVLAISLLEASDQADDAALLSEARRGLAKRDSRRRTVRLLGGLAAALLVLVAAVSGVAYVWISRQAEAERQARAEAERQRVVADQQRGIALEQRAEADLSRRRAEDALEVAQQARRAETLAQEARLREQEAKLAAEERARQRAEEALRAQEEIQRLGYLEDNSRWRFDAAAAVAMQQDAAREHGLTVEKRVAVGDSAIDMLLVPPGTYVMGSPPRDPARNNDEYLHEVTLTRPFHLSRTEVTRGQWQAVVGVETLAGLGLKPGDDQVPAVAWRVRPVPEAERNLPATGVSHDDIMNVFLPAMAKLGEGGRFRLPSEAEWEWAARAGTTGHFYAGETEKELDACAWFEGNSSGRLHPVGGKEANAWGLQDMIGNAWELAADSYDSLYYLRSPRQDPVNLDDAVVVKVSRGGGYINSSRLCRMSYRGTYMHRENRYPHAGFRLAWSEWEFTPPTPPPTALPPASNPPAW